MKKIMLSMFCIFLLVGCSTKQENITIKKNNNQETVDLKVGFGLHHIEDGYSFDGNDVDVNYDYVDNVIPYIGGEEEKSEREPLKLWGHIEGDQIVNAEKPTITAQCFRVPVSDGHTAAVFVSFDKKPTQEQMLEAWANFRGPAQELNLPSAPKQFLHYFTEPDRPQPKLDRNTENGMAVCIGRLREDTLFDYKFACMSHNTLRGAAGGAVLLAELLAAKGYFD